MNNMPNCRTALSRLALGLGASALLLAPSLAQAQADPSVDETIWGNDAAVSGDSGAASSLMDVIQRGQVGPTQSRAEFLRKQDENLNDAAAAFRARQREAFETSVPATSAQADESLSSPVETDPRPALW